MCQSRRTNDGWGHLEKRLTHLIGVGCLCVCGKNWASATPYLVCFIFFIEFVRYFMIFYMIYLRFVLIFFFFVASISIFSPIRFCFKLEIVRESFYMLASSSSRPHRCIEHQRTNGRRWRSSIRKAIRRFFFFLMNLFSPNVAQRLFSQIVYRS